MKKSIILILAVVVLLSSGVASAVECGPIPVDGCTVTKNTVFNKDVYYLPQGINIRNDSVTLDCNGATLVGDMDFSGITSFGFMSLTINKVIVKNCNVRIYATAINFDFCKNCQILNNRVTNNVYGITIQRDGSIVAHNIIKNNSFGIISTSENNKIYDNILEFNHDKAIIIDSSTSVFNNTIFNNGGGISGGLASDNNNISNNSIINTTSSDAIAIFGDNNFIGNNIIINSKLRGIGLFYSENSVIINNTIRESKLGGISLDHVKFTTIKNNNIINNSDGIVLSYSSSDNNIEFNNIFDNVGYNFKNHLTIDANAENNWWGTTVESEINESIYDYYDNDYFGIVDYQPWLNKPFDSSNVKLDIYLVKGWNLLSIPLILENNSVEEVLKDISYSELFAYDYEWYSPSHIELEAGYWIKMDSADTLTVQGIEVEETIIDLYEGWNLIGWPLLESQDIADGFENDTIYTYDGTWLSYIPGRPFNSLTTFEPGYGYWVKK